MDFFKDCLLLLFVEIDYLHQKTQCSCLINRSNERPGRKKYFNVSYFAVNIMMLDDNCLSPVLILHI